MSAAKPLASAPAAAQLAAKPPAAKAAGSAVGLEYDPAAIRAVRVSGKGKAGFQVEDGVEYRGDFSKDETLAEGLKKVKDKLSIGSKDTLVSCLAGKQIFTAQIPFRKLPPDETISALKIEIRKTLPFEVGGASLDYQILSEGADKAEQVQVLVTAAANLLLTRQLRNMERAGLKPAVVDVLPLAVANALWAHRGEDASPAPGVALHFGHSVCTFIADGTKSPYFHRSVYFSVSELFGERKELVAERERERRIASLGEEIARSLAFYEKNAVAGGFRDIVALGDHLDAPQLLETVAKHSGLEVKRMDLATRGSASKSEPGKFDLAIALALRGLA